MGSGGGAGFPFARGGLGSGAFFGFFQSIAVAVVLMLAIRVAGSVAGQGPAAGAVEKVTVHGKSLEGNLNGDTPDRSVFVYLPPSYKTDVNRRYPVVYLLHGYGLQAERWMTFARIETGANQSMTGSGGGVGTGARARETGRHRRQAP